MAKKISSVLKKVSKDLEPDPEKTREIKEKIDNFVGKLKEKLKKEKVQADVFLGGSFAKKTMIEKDIYDIDIFIRFGKKHFLQKFSDLTQTILQKFRGLQIRRIHGSRDYFRIKVSKNLLFEIIPVKKIKGTKEAENITDLSYSHVKYVAEKIKDTKLQNEIKLAKSFCYANNCYGAESYIRGFSGYALELLIIHYKSFRKFIRAMSKVKEEKKLIIDMEKHHKNKGSILMDINESKLQSPIILVDPTYKTRNVLAGLSEETFKKFQKACKKFLKRPNAKDFEKKEIDFEKIKKSAKKKRHEFVKLEAKTNKQSGDVAGTKLKKFYRHLEEEIKEYFKIKKKGFEYNGKKTAKYFFVVRKKKIIRVKGPLKSQEKHAERFRKHHEKTYVWKGRLYSKKKVNFSIKDFIKKWKLKNLRKLKEMNITGLRVVG